MSLFAYFGTPESRSFQFLWTAGTQRLFRAGPRALNRHWGEGPTRRPVFASWSEARSRHLSGGSKHSTGSPLRAEPHSLQDVPDFHAGISENALSLGPSPPELSLKAIVT